MLILQRLFLFQLFFFFLQRNRGIWFCNLCEKISIIIPILYFATAIMNASAQAVNWIILNVQGGLFDAHHREEGLVF